MRKKFTIFLILTFILGLSPINFADAITQNQIDAEVQIVCPDNYGNWYSGSGTIIDSKGIILTNKHVVTDEFGGIIKTCAIGFIESVNQEPNFGTSGNVNLAEVKYYTTSNDMDAAILYLENPTNKIYPYINIWNSNSNTLQLGDKIEVIGFPSIGGSTVTYTSGDFSGFGSKLDGTQNYIKTTASLGHGNSGGAAYSSNQFVGVPTMVVSDIDISNAISYALSVNSIQNWLSGVLGSNFKNEVIAQQPVIEKQITITQENTTPPDISKLSVSTYKSIASDYANETIAFRLSHPDNDRFYYYFGGDISADPISNGDFVSHTTILRVSAPNTDGTYYLILRIKDVYNNISDKAVYKIKYQKYSSCPQITSITNSNTGEKFKLRWNSDENNTQGYAKPVVPGGVPIKIEWEKESVSSGLKDYYISWSSSDTAGLFSKFKINVPAEANANVNWSVYNQDPNACSNKPSLCQETDSWGQTQTNNSVTTKPLKYNWQYYARLSINYDTGYASQNCDLVEINTLPAGANYKNYLLSTASQNTTTDTNLSNRLKGQILLQVEKSGEAYYVYPDNKKRYYLGRPKDAFEVMRKLGLGATHEFITSHTIYPTNVSGKILLDVEKNGEAYYIYPKDRKAYYLGRPADAFRIMRELGLGITNSDLEKIPEGNL